MKKFSTGLLLTFSTLMSFSSLAQKSPCMFEKVDRIEVVRTHVTKYKNEDLIFNINFNPNECSFNVPEKLKIRPYWKAKPGQEKFVGFTCDYPSSMMLKHIDFDQVSVEKTGNYQAKVYFPVFNMINNKFPKSNIETTFILDLVKDPNSGACSAKVTYTLQEKQYIFSSLELILSGGLIPSLSNGTITGFDENGVLAPYEFKQQQFQSTQE